MKKVIVWTLFPLLAFPMPAYTFDNVVPPAAYQDFGVSKEFGKVQEHYQGRDGRTIYFIQDAHDSPEVQYNIANILKQLIETRGVRTVYEEGYEGLVPTRDYFGSLKRDEDRKKVGDFLLDHLRLGGAEYLHLQDPGSFRLMGVDHRRLQAENIRCYAESASFRPLIEKQLRGIVDRVRKMLLAGFSAGLRKWFRQRQQFFDQLAGADVYIDGLREISEKSGDPALRFENYPQLRLVWSLKHDKATTPEMLADFSGQALFEEIERFEQAYLVSQVPPDLQTAFRIYRAMERLERLSELQVSSEEFEWIKKRDVAGLTLKAAQFLARKEKKPVALTALWEKEIRAAFQFYQTAYLRDEAFRKNLLADFKDSRAALVCGGFHADRVKQILRAEGISYVAILPAMTEASPLHQKRYQKLMRGEKYDFEMRKAARFMRPSSVYSEPRSEVGGLLQAAGVTPLPGRSETRVVDQKVLGEFLDSPDQRTELFYTAQVNELDRYLLSDSKKRGKKYVLASLRSRADLSRLLSVLKTASEGKLESVPGELSEVLTGGGVLMIDYDQSNAALAEGEFNSLFDKNAYFQKLKTIHPGLKIIGVMRPDQSRRYTTALQSRYARAHLLEFQGTKPSDPLEGIFEKVESESDLPADAVVIDLADGDPFDSSLPMPLVSGVQIDGKGSMKILAGGLVTAAQTGRPLVIRRGKFEESSPLMRFLRRAAVLGLTVDGKSYDLQGKIYGIQEASPQDQDIAAQKQLIAPEEATGGSAEDVWVIHSANAGLLFRREQITGDGEIVALPSVLSQPGARVLIAGNLPLSVWHRLMASPGLSRIEVAPGVRVPAIYRAMRSAALEKSSGKDQSQAPQAWEQVTGQKVIYVETSDVAMTEDSLRERFPGDTILPFPVNPDPSLKYLTGEIEQDGTDRYRHTARNTEILNALKAGQTVFLTGFESNPELAGDLLTLTAPEPYLLVNGERLFLRDLPGRIILAFHPSMKKHRPQRRVVEDNSLERQKKILTREFPGQLTGERWGQILRLQAELAKSFPDVSLDWGVNRMRLLLREVARNGDWNAALQKVVGNHFWGEPKKYAFVRLLIRHTFGVDDAGRGKRTVAWERIRVIMDEKMVQPLIWNDFDWQIADALSTDLALEIWPNGMPVFQNGASDAFKTVRQAMAPASGEDGRPRLDREFEKNLDVKQRQLEQTGQALRDERAAMTIGLPGVGKSYNADELAKQLGYGEDQIVKRTTGAGMQSEDLLGDKDQRGLEYWANLKEGGLLLIDEANLADPDFWNFLRGFFAANPYVWIRGRRVMLTKNHRILFTGNPYTMPGRRFQKLLEEFVITVPYEAFSPEFLRDQVRRNLDRDTPEHEKISELIYGIYAAVGKLPGMSGELSLRDLNGLTERVNVLLPNPRDRTREQVLWIAWRQFRGMLSLEQQGALRLYLHTTLGGQRLDWIREKFPEGAEFEGITMTDSTGRFLNDVIDSLKMRESDINKATAARDADIPYQNKGKSGFIVEGASGRLKSEGIVAVLKSRGYVEAENAPPGFPATKKFYRLVASPGSAGQLIEQVRKAQREGAIVVIDELNLLPTNFLEGILNDVLTGAATPGFFLFASMNSSDFAGRQKLSSALQNRVIYQRLDPYSETELNEIALADLGALPAAKEAAKLLARFHVWLCANIEDASRHPTPRELRAAAQAMAKGATFEAAVESVYGTRFLELMRPGGSAEVPARKTLETFKPKAAQDVKKTIQLFAAMFFPPEMKLPVIEIIESNTANGVRISSTHTIQINENLLGSDEWLGTLLHEISHGLFTTGKGPTGAADGIWQDLEDIRHQRAFELLFPEGKIQNQPLQGSLSDASSLEQPFAEMIREGRYEGLKSTIVRTTVSARQIFQLVLTVAARELVTYEQLSQFADGMPAELLNLFPSNPFKAALPFTEAVRNYIRCVPPAGATRGEIEGQFDRAVAELNGIEDIAGTFSGEPLLERADGKQNLPLEQNPAALRPSGTLPDLNVLVAQNREKRVAGMRDQLDEMLKEIFFETDDRIQEIEEQLTDPKHSHSLVPELEFLNDEGLNWKKQAILWEIAERSKRANRAGMDGGREGPGWGGGLGDWSGGLDRAGEFLSGSRSGMGGQQAKGARYKGGKHGVHGDQTIEAPPVVIETTVSFSENVVIASAGFTAPERDPLMQDITKQTESEEAFLTVLAALFLDPNLPEGSFGPGPNGTLDIQQLIYTRKLEESFWHLSESEDNLTPRPFVLTLGDAQSVSWNPVTIEFFHYLFDRGFSVTVYLDAGRRQAGIRDFKTLAAVLNAAQNVPREKILEDHKARGEAAPPVFSIEKLQEMVEGEIYLSGVLRKAARGERLGPEKPAGEAAVETAAGAPAVDPALEVRRKAIETEVDKIFTRDEFVVAIENGEIELRCFTINALKRIGQLSGVKGIDVINAWISPNDPDEVNALKYIEQYATGEFRKNVRVIRMDFPGVKIDGVRLTGFDRLEEIKLVESYISITDWAGLDLEVQKKIKRLAFAVGVGTASNMLKNFSRLEALDMASVNWTHSEEIHPLVRSRIKSLRISHPKGIEPDLGLIREFLGLTELELDLPNALTIEELRNIPEEARARIKKLRILNNGKIKDWSEVAKMFPNLEELDHGAGPITGEALNELKAGKDLIGSIRERLRKLMDQGVLSKRFDLENSVKEDTIDFSQMSASPDIWRKILACLAGYQGMVRFVRSNIDEAGLEALPPDITSLNLAGSGPIKDWTFLRRFTKLEFINLEDTSARSLNFEDLFEEDEHGHLERMIWADGSDKNGKWKFKGAPKPGSPEAAVEEIRKKLRPLLDSGVLPADFNLQVKVWVNMQKAQVDLSDRELSSADWKKVFAAIQGCGILILDRSNIDDLSAVPASVRHLDLERTKSVTNPDMSHLVNLKFLNLQGSSVDEGQFEAAPDGNGFELFDRSGNGKPGKWRFKTKAEPGGAAALQKKICDRLQPFIDDGTLPSDFASFGISIVEADDSLIFLNNIKLKDPSKWPAILKCFEGLRGGLVSLANTNVTEAGLEALPSGILSLFLADVHSIKDWTVLSRFSGLRTLSLKNTSITPQSFNELFEEDVNGHLKRIHRVDGQELNGSWRFKTAPADPNKALERAIRRRLQLFIDDGTLPNDFDLEDKVKWGGINFQGIRLTDPGRWPDLLQCLNGFKGSVDLGGTNVTDAGLEALPADIIRLVLNNISSVTNWTALSRFSRLNGIDLENSSAGLRNNFEDLFVEAADGSIGIIVWTDGSVRDNRKWRFKAAATQAGDAKVRAKVIENRLGALVKKGVLHPDVLPLIKVEIRKDHKVTVELSVNLGSAVWKKVLEAVAGCDVLSLERSDIDDLSSVPVSVVDLFLREAHSVKNPDVSHLSKLAFLAIQNSSIGEGRFVETTDGTGFLLEGLDGKLKNGKWKFKAQAAPGTPEARVEKIRDNLRPLVKAGVLPSHFDPSVSVTLSISGEVTVIFHDLKLDSARWEQALKATEGCEQLFLQRSNIEDLSALPDSVNNLIVKDTPVADDQFVKSTDGKGFLLTDRSGIDRAGLWKVKPGPKPGPLVAGLQANLASLAASGVFPGDFLDRAKVEGHFDDATYARVTFTDLHLDADAWRKVLEAIRGCTHLFIHSSDINDLSALPDSVVYLYLDNTPFAENQFIQTTNQSGFELYFKGSPGGPRKSGKWKFKTSPEAESPAASIRGKLEALVKAGVLPSGFIAADHVSDIRGGGVRVGFRDLQLDPDAWEKVLKAIQGCTWLNINHSKISDLSALPDSVTFLDLEGTVIDESRFFPTTDESGFKLIDHKGTHRTGKWRFNSAQKTRGPEAVADEIRKRLRPFCEVDKVLPPDFDVETKVAVSRTAGVVQVFLSGVSLGSEQWKVILNACQGCEILDLSGSDIDDLAAVPDSVKFLILQDAKNVVRSYAGHLVNLELLNLADSTISEDQFEQAGQGEGGFTLINRSWVTKPGKWRFKTQTESGALGARRAAIEAEVAKIFSARDDFGVLSDEGEIILHCYTINMLKRLGELSHIEGIDRLVVRLVDAQVPGDLDAFRYIDAIPDGKFRKNLRSIRVVVAPGSIKGYRMTGFDRLEEIVPDSHGFVKEQDWEGLDPQVQGRIKRVTLSLTDPWALPALLPPGGWWRNFHGLTELDIRGGKYPVLQQIAEHVRNRIKSLRIWNNDNVAPWLEKVGEFPAVTELDLDFPNALTLEELARIPEAVRNRIKKLTIQHNLEITDPADIVKLFPNLESLDFNKESITGTDLAALKGTAKAETVSLAERLDRIRKNLGQLVAEGVLGGDFKVEQNAWVVGGVSLRVNLARLRLSPGNWEKVLKAVEGCDVLYLNDTDIDDLSAVPASVSHLDLSHANKSIKNQDMSHLTGLRYLDLTKGAVDESQFVPAEGENGFELMGLDGQTKPGLWKFKAAKAARPFDLEDPEQFFEFLDGFEKNLLRTGVSYDEALARLEREGYDGFVKFFREEYQKRFGREVPSGKSAAAKPRSEVRDVRHDERLQKMIGRLYEMKALVLIDSATLAGLSGAQLEEYVKILAESQKSKIYVAGDGAESENERTLKKNFHERIQRGLPLPGETADQCLYLGKPESFQPIAGDLQDRKIVKMTYEGGEVGLPTLGLLYPEEEILALQRKYGFLTWSKLGGVASVAAEVLAAIVVGTAA